MNIYNPTVIILNNYGKLMMTQWLLVIMTGFLDLSLGPFIHSGTSTNFDTWSESGVIKQRNI
jgi:hypothetical protein